MSQNTTIIIPFSKAKLLLSNFGAFAFVACGFWFVLDPPSRTGSSFEAVFLMVLGIAIILFFGSVAFVVIPKLFDQRPGLIINEEGISDNSGGLSAGQIFWKDIVDLKVLEIKRQKLLLIFVRNPQDYIDRHRHSLQRKLASMNHQQYGTPLSISTATLKISFNELTQTIIRQLEEFQQRTR